MFMEEVLTMRKINISILTIIMMMLLSILVMADGELADPGMTPDSPVYFLDEVSDVFQAPEAVTDEKAAEVVAMAEKGNEKALAKAIEKYDKALLKLKKKAYLDEEKTAKVSGQVGKHLAVLSKVLEQVPENAKPSIQKVIEKSAKGLSDSFKELKALNAEKGKKVAEETLQKVLAYAPEAAQKGLQNALDKVIKNEAQDSKKNADDSQKKAEELQKQLDQLKKQLEEAEQKKSEQAAELQMKVEEAQKQAEEAKKKAEELKQVADKAKELLDALEKAKQQGPKKLAQPEVSSDNKILNDKNVANIELLLVEIKNIPAKDQPEFISDIIDEMKKLPENQKKQNLSKN